MSYDIIIKNGLYFDGSGAPGAGRLAVKKAAVIEMT